MALTVAPADNWLRPTFKPVPWALTSPPATPRRVRGEARVWYEPLMSSKAPLVISMRMGVVAVAPVKLAIRRALLPTWRSPLVALLVDRPMGPPLNLMTEVPVALVTSMGKEGPLAIRPLRFRTPPPVPKAMVREFAVVRM